MEAKQGIKIREMSDNDFIAYLQAKSPEERHVTMCLTIGDTFKSACKGNNESGFERDFVRLKSYMGLHRWSKEFISARFGVDFSAMRRLYFKILKGQ